jgi:FixJ family two-component response regulator
VLDTDASFLTKPFSQDSLVSKVQEALAAADGE